MAILTKLRNLALGEFLGTLTQGPRRRYHAVGRSLGAEFVKSKCNVPPAGRSACTGALTCRSRASRRGILDRRRSADSAPDVALTSRQRLHVAMVSRSVKSGPG